MFKSSLRHAAICATMPLLLAGTSAFALEKADIRIAAVYENTSDAFWGSYMCGAKAKAAELGIKLEVASQATPDSAKLATALDTALLTAPLAAIVNPIDPAPWSTKIASLMAAGLAVSTVQNFDAIPTQYSYSQADDAGAPFAPMVLDLVGKGKTGKAVTLLGLAKAPWQDNRVAALENAIKEANPEMQFLDAQVDGFDVNKGTQLISSLIVANPDLKVILAVAGPEGQAVAAAIKQTGATGITVIAFDAVPAEVAGIRDGTIQMLIAQPAYGLGGAQVEQLVGYLTSAVYAPGKPVKAQSGTPSIQKVGIISKANVDAPETKQFIYNGDCQ